MNSITDHPSSSISDTSELVAFLSESPVPLEILDKQERVKQKLADHFLKMPYYKQRQEADPNYLDSLATSFVNISD